VNRLPASAADSPAKARLPEPCLWSARKIAAEIAAGRISAREVTAAYLARIEQIEPALGALVVSLADDASRQAAVADERQASGATLPPLHGVPVTIKECYDIAGVPTTIGLTTRVKEIATADALLVARLRAAGAIVLGKSNVPQLMIQHECDNPVYGRTSNPWNPERTPGGSTGGEGALLAAGGTALGLGSDLGGSIRIPCHFCGVHGIKPTSRRLSRRGSLRALRGMNAIQAQPGPLARSVGDLSLALRLLGEGPPHEIDPDCPPMMWREPSEVKIEKLRIAFWIDDGYFAVSPAVRRAVEESAAALEAAGCIVEAVQPREVRRAMELYFGLVSADGAADFGRWLEGGVIERRVARLVSLGGTSRWLRPISAWVMRRFGEPWLAELFSIAGPRSVDEYWQMIDETKSLRDRFLREVARFDAILCPAYALPAFPHGRGLDLMPAASYSFFINLLDVPAGVVAATRVRPGEELLPRTSSDTVEQAAHAAEEGSAGLPIGVQVVGQAWREDIVLRVMEFLETHFRSQPDYPELAPFAR